MRLMQQTIFTTYCLIYLAASENREMSIGQYESSNYQHPSDEIYRKVQNWRSKIYNVIKLINPISYFWNNERNSPRKSTEAFNQNQNKYRTSVVSNLIDSLNIGSTEKSQDSLKLERNGFKNVFSNNTERLIDKKQSKFVNPQRTDSIERNNAQNNYNTDIMHNYKSLAAFNINVAPFLTRRTRSAKGSPIIVSPYLSHRTSHPGPVVGASPTNIHHYPDSYQNLNPPNLSPRYIYSAPFFNKKRQNV